MKKTALFLAAVLMVQAAAAKDIVAENAYARATVGQPQSGAFMTLNNSGKQDDVLVAAQVSPDVAETVELHTHVNDKGVMRMVEVKEGIAVKAGTTVELKPGGYHVMFIGLKNDLKPGQKFPLTLKFKSGASETVEVNVRDMKAKDGKGHAHAHDHKHDHKNHKHGHKHGSHSH